jgi:acyl-CoA thioesterase FadM
MHPARMADELIVETTMQYNPNQQNAKIELSHAIVKNNLTVVEGTTILGICNEKFELLYRIPDDIREYIDKQIDLYRKSPLPFLKVIKG